MIKIIDGKVYREMGDIPTGEKLDNLHCSNCEFYCGDGTFQHHRGYSCYDTEYEYKCRLGGGYSTSVEHSEKEAQDLIFKHCPLKGKEPMDY